MTSFIKVTDKYLTTFKNKSKKSLSLIMKTVLKTFIDFEEQKL